MTIMMSDQQIRIAVAEACGWKFTTYTCTLGEITHATKPGCGPDNVPDYPNDLNAILPLLPAGTNILRCHEHWIVYFDGYTVSASHQDLAHAACEFYLKTIGKWKD